jgi:hypothetical protein
MLFCRVALHDTPRPHAVLWLAFKAPTSHKIRDGRSVAYSELSRVDAGERARVYR